MNDVRFGSALFLRRLSSSLLSCLDGGRGSCCPAPGVCGLCGLPQEFVQLDWSFHPSGLTGADEVLTHTRPHA